MTEALVSNLEKSGEKRAFAANGQAVLGNAGGIALMKGTFEPGWRWSKDIAPIAGTKTCQNRHLGYVLSGRIHVTFDDGTETEIGPGDIFDLPAGHDAYVVGDKPCVMLDISSDVTRYATSGMAAGKGDKYQALVQKGYAAFNAGDMETLATLMSHDVQQHVPGSSKLAGAYKGIDAVFSYYGKLAEETGGTFRAHLVETHSDAGGHVTAVHQTVATRNGVTRVSRGSILFTFLGDKVTDLLELRADNEGDDAFLA
jgi:ketosteroid isomerase-like protein